MRAKKYMIMMAIFLVALLICSSCAGEIDSTLVTLTFNEVSDYSITALVDGKIIYQTLDNPTLFFSLDIEQNKLIEIGSVPNYILNGYSLVHDAGKLYTYITTSDDNFEHLKNVLYKIDLTNDTISHLTSNKNLSPIIFIYKTPDGILQLKTPSVGSDLQTYFDVYDPQTGDSNVVLIAQEGEVYVIASMYEQSLFVFVAHKKLDSNYEYFIREYDTVTYDLINTIKLGSMHDYIARAPVYVKLVVT